MVLSILVLFSFFGYPCIHFVDRLENWGLVSCVENFCGVGGLENAQKCDEIFERLPRHVEWHGISNSSQVDEYE